MDKTKEYIEKCEKAEKIQKQWKPKEGDWFYWSKKGVVCLGHYVPMSPTIVTPGGYDYDFQDIDYAKCVWLLTQDQLQKLHGWKFENQAIRFWEWASEYNPETKELCSWEQLWLGLVMKDNYRKVWDGKDWRKE